MELESLGILELSDERTRVRQTDGTLTKISELLAGAGVTMTQVQSTVNAAVAAAIASLVSGAPEALNTLSEISSALNNDGNAYATLLALIQAKNPLLTFPSSATSTNLLSGSTDTFAKAPRALFVGSGARLHGPGSWSRLGWSNSRRTGQPWSRPLSTRLAYKARPREGDRFVHGGKEDRPWNPVSSCPVRKLRSHRP